MRMALIALSGALIVTACADRKAASNANFKTAIDRYVSTQPACIAAPDTSLRPAKDDNASFPQYLDARPVSPGYQQEQRQRDAAPLEALVAGGLLRKSSGQIAVQMGYIGDHQETVPVTTYDLTEAGRKALTPGKHGTFVGTKDTFCYGHPAVDEVTQFTEPSEMMGVKLSQVSYTYHLADVPGWASNGQVRAAFPALARDLAPSLTGRAAVVLTNNGWVHEKAANL